MPNTSPPLPHSLAFKWLQSGWFDMVNTRCRGCFYGAVFVIMGYFIALIYGNLWQATMSVTAGFFLMGPFVC